MDLETLKEEVRARADIVDIVGRYVKLQRASGSWKGLCPFHQEKTPSFTVNPRRQTYHCFGCNEGGDVFRFIMETERLDFMGALERLAHQVGVPFELDGARGGGTKKKRLLELHEKVATYYQEQLQDPTTGKAAMTYVRERELEVDTPSAYRLGYAPNGFEHLLGLVRSWGFEPEELEASGLFSQRDNPRNGEVLFDRFRNRLMFPILDEQSRVIGFSGRVIPPDDAKAKYMNSPETLLFKKSRVLYGIDKARKPMTENRRAVLCEGQLDVIRCHESGIAEAVAAQGTAVTEEHAAILKRYADEVLLLLDADEAGVKAALRSAEVLLKTGLSVRVAALPQGQDPDDVVRAKGNKALREIVKDAEPFVVFQVKTLVKREGNVTETSRLRIAREVMELIAAAPEALHREELLRQAAEALGMREDALRLDLEAVRKQGSTPPRRSEPAKPHFSTRTAPKAQPASSESSSVSGTPSAAEALLVDLLCSYPEQLPLARAYLRPEHLRHPQTRQIMEILLELPSPDRNAILDAIREHPEGHLLAGVDQRNALQLEGDLGTPEEAMQNLIVVLRREALVRTRAAVQTRNAGSDQDRELQLFTLTHWIAGLKSVASHPGKPLEWEKAQALLTLMDQQSI